MFSTAWVSTTELIAARRTVDAAEAKRVKVRALLSDNSASLFKDAAVPKIDFSCLGAKAMINCGLGQPSPSNVSQFVVGKKQISVDSIVSDLSTILRHPASRSSQHVDWTNAGVLVEELFPEAKGYRGAEHLSDYYIITLNLPASALDASPHDVAYALRSQFGYSYARANISGQLAIRRGNGGDGDPGPHPPPPPPNPIPSSPPPPVDDHAWSLRKMNIINAWAKFPNGRSGAGAGILIGHPDTGWRPHFDVQADTVAPNGNGEINVALGWNTYDPQFPPFTNRHNAIDPLNPINPFHGHGTTGVSVAVSRGGVTDGPGGTDPDPASSGGFRVAGVAPAAKMVPVRCTELVLVLPLIDIAVERAISYAAFNAQVDVISVSLGSIGLSISFALLLDTVLKANIVFVAAAGQLSGQTDLPFGLAIPFPAAFPGVLAVTGITRTDEHAGFKGAKIGIAAPAQGIWEDSFDGGGRPIREMLPKFATSFATTQMAGVAALWLSFHGKGALRARFKHTSLSSVFASLMPLSAVPPAQWDTSNWGPGVIDAVKLLEAPIPVESANRNAAEEQDLLPESLGLQVLARLFEHLSLSELLARFCILFHQPAAATETLLDAFAEELTLLFVTVPEFMQTFGAASLSMLESPADAIATVIDRAHSIVFAHGSKTLQAAMTQAATVVAHLNRSVAHENSP